MWINDKLFIFYFYVHSKKICKVTKLFLDNWPKMPKTICVIIFKNLCNRIGQMNF